MSLEFYFAPHSTATLTQLVLAELGVEHNAHQIDLQAGGAKTPEFLKINPNAKVPVIVHDGVAIFESAAITMYLGELFGVAKGLYPAPGPKRGEAMKWIVWTNVTLGEAVYRWAYNTQGWVPAEQANAAAGAAALAQVQELLAIADNALADRQFLCGEYSLADTHMHSFMGWLRAMKIDFSAHQRLGAWSERCSARPAWKQVEG
jgi:glutathione S-transferase